MDKFDFLDLQIVSLAWMLLIFFKLETSASIFGWNDPFLMVQWGQFYPTCPFILRVSYSASCHLAQLKKTGNAIPLTKIKVFGCFSGCHALAKTKDTKSAKQLDHHFSNFHSVKKVSQLDNSFFPLSKLSAWKINCQSSKKKQIAPCLFKGEVAYLAMISRNSFSQQQTSAN